jgi:hypothetical protein
MARLAANVSVAITCTGDIARSNVPGRSAVALDGKDKGKEEGEVGKLHFSIFRILDNV